MAKRPRMGRNLDALLGSSVRERNSKPAATPTDAAVPLETDTAHAGEAAQSTEPADSAGQADRQSHGQASSPAEANSARVEGHAAAEASAGPTNSPENPVASGAGTQDQPASADESTVAVDTTPGTPADGFVPVSDAMAAEGRGDTDELNQPVVQGPSGSADKLRMVGVDQIRRGSYQPRRLFDKELLQELADSIRAEGLIQPIIVRPFAGAYELVAGERRWRAAQLAGMAEIPAIVRDMEDQSVAAVSLIENIQRKDLNPLEEAAAFERLCDEFGMTHKAVAESVGRSRASVTNLMRLLELHDEVKVLVDKGELEMGHARTILGAPKDRQHALARDVIKRGLTVRAVEKLVRDILAEGEEAPPGKSASVNDPDIERLSQKLGETLGAAVRIQHKSNGRGKLEINYSSVSELQGILAHIK